MTIEDIRGLVKQEKNSEEKIREAQEEADNIIKKWKKDAQKILQNAEDQNYYDGIFAVESRKIDDKKKLIEKETEKKIELIRETAKKNLEKTVSLIVNRILEE